MNCGDVGRALMEESVPSRLPAQAQEHLKGCQHCQELVRAVNLRVPADVPSPTTLSQIELGIFADLRPVRPVAPKRYLFATLIAAFVCVVGLVVYCIGPFAITVMSPLQAGAILGALAISTGLLAYSLVHQMIPGSRHRIPPRSLPVGIMISLTAVVAVLFQFQHERDFWASGWSCIRTGTSIGALAAVPFWLILRRGAILSPSMTGAAAGLFAGLVGTAALEIHCPNLDAWHILVSHLGVAALGAMAGLAMGLVAEIVNSRARSPHR